MLPIRQWCIWKHDFAYAMGGPLDIWGGYSASEKPKSHHLRATLVIWSKTMPS